MIIAQMTVAVESKGLVYPGKHWQKVAPASMVAVVITLQISRRVGNYAIIGPAREMLFAAVDRETRVALKPNR